jgi:hypothetical protein
MMLQKKYWHFQKEIFKNEYSFLVTIIAHCIINNGIQRFTSKRRLENGNIY